MKRHLLICFGLILILSDSFSQVFSNKEVGRKNERLIDSLKAAEYPYALPIWGDKATDMGFNLPHSAGVSVQYFWSESDIVIENLMIGFNGGQMYNVDEIIRFNNSVATASAVTVRPDIWLFPFLNIYGILGKSQASTQIDAGLWLPDGENNYTEVLPFATQVDFKATTFGLGMTPTIGVGGGFLALDMNVAWTDVPQLDDPAFSFIFGPRLGKNFKLAKPERSIAVWAGAFRVHIKSGTNGSVPLSEVFPPGTLGGRVDEGFAKVDNAYNQVNSWWTSLSEAEQNNPLNQAKYEKANSALDRASEILVAADGAISTIESSTVQYSMDKRVKDMWNFLVGGQFQLNKHFMYRLEYGFLGSRQQVMTGIQYRFGL